MSNNYRLSEEAESDVYDAYLWYEKQKESLGEDFLNSLDAAGLAIAGNPITYRIRYKKKVSAFVTDCFLTWFCILSLETILM